MARRLKVPVTEQLHPDGPGLSRLSTARLLARLHAGDREAVRAVSGALPSLTDLVEEAVAALARGGRLVYVGAGTSGRLGVLDASEPHTVTDADGNYRIGNQFPGKATVRIVKPAAWAWPPNFKRSSEHFSRTDTIFTSGMLLSDPASSSPCS